MSRIHTLNARGNLMLAAIREHYSWTDERTFKEVQRFHQDFLQILSGKRISYDKLRTALIPQTNKHEAAFLFDEHRCDPDRIPGVDADGVAATSRAGGRCAGPGCGPAGSV